MKEPLQSYKEIVDLSIPRQRLDKYIADTIADLSRTRCQSLIKGQYVSVDDQIITNISHMVVSGSIIKIDVPAAEETELLPENKPLNIVYEDNDLLVVNKPAGLSVHPGAGQPTGTLANILAYHCRDSLSGIGGVLRPGIVHRIDKNTSGLLVVAKNDYTHQHLSQQFAAHTIKRKYHAIVSGILMKNSGTIESTIGRHPIHRKKMAVLSQDKGRHAITHFKRLKVYPPLASLVECSLETGRTHQIRVHMAHITYPVLGDPVYGGDIRQKHKKANNDKINLLKNLLFWQNRQMLHAVELGFIHPKTKKAMLWHSEYPDDFLEVIDILS